MAFETILIIQRYLIAAVFMIIGFLWTKIQQEQNLNRFSSKKPLLGCVLLGVGFMVFAFQKGQEITTLIALIIFLGLGFFIFYTTLDVFKKRHATWKADLQEIAKPKKQKDHPIKL